MKQFHLMHCIPEFTHGPNGYKEVIDTVKWGLEQLGYSVSYAINNYCPNSTNIIFGAQMLPINYMKNLPKDTIIYNLEQLRGIEGLNIRPEMRFYAEHFEVWEYSLANLSSWRSIGKTAKLVPISYAPILNRIIKPEVQDIDVLIYGAAAQNRLMVLNQLAYADVRVMFFCGLYGKMRDDLIARTKVIVNVGIYESKVFEIVRVSYLLANKKAVIAVLDEDTFIEDDIKSSIKPTTFENVLKDTCQLLKDDATRTYYENQGFELFTQRDICDSLKNNLS